MFPCTFSGRAIDPRPKASKANLPTQERAATLFTRMILEKSPETDIKLYNWTSSQKLDLDLKSFAL